MKVQVPVLLEVEEIAESCYAEEAAALIKAIDAAQEDWEFTLEMAKHFVGLLRGCKGLEPEYTSWLTA